VLARQLDLCLDQRARDLVDPPPTSWRRRLRPWRVPLVVAAVAVPNLLASLYNIDHNQALITGRLSERTQQLFATSTLITNVLFFALAAILLVVIFVGIGAQTPSTTIGSVSSCIPAVDVAGQCQNTSEPPALAAGLQPDDRIVSYGGQPIQTWSDLQREIAAHPSAVSVVVEREGEEQTFVVQPFLADRVVVDSYGEPVLDSNGEMVVENVPYLGVTPRFELQRQPVSTALSYLWQGTVATVQAVLRIPVLMVDLVNGLLSNEPRDPTGLVSIIGVGQLAVEIAASDDLGLHLATRVASMLSLLASLNLALFVFNLLPLLPMDGGHVAAALWEGLKKIRARLTGAVFRPADTARLTPLTYLMTLLLISMAVLLIVTDLLKPLSIGL